MAANALVAHPNALFNAARSWERAGELSRAIELYRQYLSVARSTANRRTAQDTLDRLVATPATLIVDSDPHGASVYLDAATVPAGVTPYTLRLSAGRHTLSLVHTDFRRAHAEVHLSPGESTHERFMLVREMPTPQTVLVSPAQPSRPTPARPVAQRSEPSLYERIVQRRTGPFTLRGALLVGFAAPRDRQNLALGFEVAGFYRRHFTFMVHGLSIDTDGAPFLLTGDVGWAITTDDLDVTVGVHGGALFRCDVACREGSFGRDEVQFIGGLTLKADVMFHPRVGAGLYGRVSWRNLDLSDTASLLTSVGLSISVYL